MEKGIKSKKVRGFLTAFEKFSKARKKYFETRNNVSVRYQGLNGSQIGEVNQHLPAGWAGKIVSDE